MHNISEEEMKNVTRSASINRLTVPTFCPATDGKRASPVFDEFNRWNELASNITSAPSLMLI